MCLQGILVSLKKAEKERGTNPVIEHNARNAFRVPKELVNIVVSDNGFMILVASHKFPVDDLVALVPDKSVKRLHHSSQIKPLGNMVESVLALWRPVIVIRTLEDEAETLGHEPHLCRFAPAEKVERNWPQAVVLAHIVHGIPPSIVGCGEGLFVRRRLPRVDLNRVNPGFWVLPDGIVQIKLGRKIPPSSWRCGHQCSWHAMRSKLG